MKRRLLLFLAAVGVVVILWAVFSARKDRVTLADGTTLTFQGVSVGLSNRYCFGNAAQRMAAKLRWPWAQKYAASALLTVPADRDTNLVVWVTYRGAAPRAGRFRFRCVHDGGTNDLAFSGITKYGLPSGEAATGFYTAFWPRRSKRFSLQAHEDDAASGKPPLWEIRVPNPLHSDYPHWQPEVLPGRRTVGDVSFILDGLVPSESRAASKAVWGPFASIPVWHPIDAETLQARLRVTSGDQPNDDWEICSVRFRDALGNPFQQFRQSKMRSHGGRHDLDFVMPLLAGERAGKLGVAFVRTRELPTNELFTLPEMGLPGPGRSLSQTLRTNTPLGEISFSVIAHNPLTRSFDSETDIEVSVIDSQLHQRDFAEPGVRWFQPFAARDDRGRNYSFTTDRAGIFDAYSFHRIRVPRDARSLVFTVAAPPVVFVEYTVGRESITRPK
jgi:hypothetical protein